MAESDVQEPRVDGARMLADQVWVIAGLIERFVLPRSQRPRSSGFESRARAIVCQQPAGAAAAAAAIHGRFRALIDGPLTPEAVLALPESTMRSAGLSRNKVADTRDPT